MAMHRSVGVEIEFGGLNVGDTVAAVTALFGGEVEEPSRHAMVVRATRLGDFKVKLDTRFAESERAGGIDRGVASGVLDAVQGLLPVEVTAPPVAPSSLPELDRLVERLVEAGARGTRQHPASAFGVHLNPSVERVDVEALHGWLVGFSLGYAWLAREVDANWTRRLLSFAEPYPEAYVVALCHEPLPRDVGTLVDGYVGANPTRNRALDMLPVFAFVAPERIEAAIPDEPVSARPALHYRLPDARLGQEPGWSLQVEWQRWLLLARVASDPIRLGELRQSFVGAGLYSRSDEWRQLSGPWFEPADERAR